MERYEKYKDSGVDWIGEIPEHWEPKKIKFAIDFHDSKRIPLSADERGKMLSKKYDYYGASGVIDKVEDYIFDGTYILLGEDGANLIARNSPLAFKASGKFWVNNHAHILTPKGGELDYFVYLLESADYTTLISGSAQPKLTAEALGNFLILNPPHEAQKAIASYLDRKTAEIDKLIAQKERLIELYKEEKTAIINQAVTKGINPDVKLKDSGIDWLGEIPEHWDVQKLRYIGSCQNGVSKGADYFGSGYPFVNYTDVYANLELPQTVVGLAKSSEEDRINYSVKKGDVFFTRTSETIEEIGFASTCTTTLDNAIFSGFLIRFRPFENFLSEHFSKYYFRSKLHRFFFVKEMNLVTRASLSQELLKRLPILLPSLKEQKVIAEYLENETDRINAKIAKTKKLIALQKEYRTALISEVVTGKIKVTQEVTQ